MVSSRQLNNFQNASCRVIIVSWESIRRQEDNRKFTVLCAHVQTPHLIIIAKQMFSLLLSVRINSC